MARYRSRIFTVFFACILVCAIGCRCNEVPGQKAARPLPFDAEASGLNNNILDVAVLTAQLMKGSKGAPHKLSMIFYSIFEVFKGTKSEESAVSAGYSALSLALADESDKLLMLKERMSYLNISPANGSVLMTTKKVFMKHMPNKNFTYMPPNEPSSQYDADCSSLTKSDKWQPQCVQMMPGGKCMKQKFSLGGVVNAPLVSFGGKRNASEYLKTIPGAPTFDGKLSDLSINKSGFFYEQYYRVLESSSLLDDRKKFMAEFFQPNGAWLFANVAINELIARNVGAYDAAFALFTVTAALRDGAVSAATMKHSQGSARPLSVIQCGWGDYKNITAWRGPYMGVGTLDVKWRPYLQTPPHPGYVSGYATATSAGATALAAVLGDK